MNVIEIDIATTNPGRLTLDTAQSSSPSLYARTQLELLNPPLDRLTLFAGGVLTMYYNYPDDVRKGKIEERKIIVTNGSPSRESNVWFKDASSSQPMIVPITLNRGLQMQYPRIDFRMTKI